MNGKTSALTAIREMLVRANRLAVFEHPIAQRVKVSAPHSREANKLSSQDIGSGSNKSATISPNLLLKLEPSIPPHGREAALIQLKKLRSQTYESIDIGCVSVWIRSHRSEVKLT